jgi:penicillin-insensitive murein endopeptidase
MSNWMKMTRIGLMAARICLTAAVAIIWASPLMAASGPADTSDLPIPPRRPTPAEMKKPSVRTNVAAKTLFGAAGGPAPLAARSIGSYTRGCLAGGKGLEINGPAWQVMRLSRNRRWGHPSLVDYVEDLAKDAPALGWNGLLVGDLSQPRGGPMLSGHASHQLGLDADIWMRPMPARVLSRAEREKISSISVLAKSKREVNGKVWTAAHTRLLRRAAMDKRVARIFVNPAIKKQLCKWTGSDRRWLRRIRPWYGHHYHFHVRLKCPRGSAGCKDQNPPPNGDGCNASIEAWITKLLQPKKRLKKPKKKVKYQPVTLAHLPRACTRVLLAR